MRFCFIAEHQYLYPVKLLCGAMNVSRSGFYSYLARIYRGPSLRKREAASLLEQIQTIFEESSKRYGSPRIHVELSKRRIVCSLRGVKRLMRQTGMYALLGRKYKHRKKPETLPETANLLAPTPAIVAANQVWYADITLIKTAEGLGTRPARAGLCPFKLYLAAVMDAYSKRIVGYAMADHMRTDLVTQALRMATKQRRCPKGLIHHSDKGSQCQRSAEACRTPHMPTGASWQPGGCF